MEENTKKQNSRFFTGSKALKIIVFIIFVVYAVSMLYPFVWAVLSSLKGKLEYFQDSFGFPEKLRFSNYKKAFQVLNANGTNMFVMIFNSLWYCIGYTFLSLLSSVMVAYAVAKYRFVGRDLIYRVAIVIMMIPIVGNLPATFLLFKRLGIYNSPFILISAVSGFGFEFMVLYSYFRNLSWSYAEAAFIDGAGHFRVFFSIMIPQAISAIAALALIAFINNWNNYMHPILFLPDYPTLSAGLYIYQTGQERSLDFPVLYAGVLMSMIPVLTLFILFQNTLMEMSIAGGLKE